MTLKSLLKGAIMATMISSVADSAVAADTTLNRAQLDGLLTGSTAYIDVPPGGPGGPGGGVAFAYYGSDGRATFKLPTGTILRGVWSLKDDHYCADWENGPKNSCTRLIKASGTILVVDVATGHTRGQDQQNSPGQRGKAVKCPTQVPGGQSQAILKARSRSQRFKLTGDYRISGRPPFVAALGTGRAARGRAHVRTCRVGPGDFTPSLSQIRT
jgi:hypothetical protein